MVLLRETAAQTDTAMLEVFVCLTWHEKTRNIERGNKQLSHLCAFLFTQAREGKLRPLRFPSNYPLPCPRALPTKRAATRNTPLIHPRAKKPACTPAPRLPHSTYASSLCAALPLLHRNIRHTTPMAPELFGLLQTIQKAASKTPSTRETKLMGKQTVARTMREARFCFTAIG